MERHGTTVKKGLEASYLAIIDVEAAAPYSREVVQTPEAGKEGSLVTHYATLITQRATDILKYTVKSGKVGSSSILVVDGSTA